MLDKAANWILLLLVVLLPVAVIPLASVPFSFTKTALLAAGVLLVFILCAFRQLRDGVLLIPRHPLLLAVWAIPAAYLVSALFSGNIRDSLAGNALATDTAGFYLIAALLLSVSAYLLRSKGRILEVYFAFLVSFVILALFQGARLVLGPETLSLGIFGSPLSNLLDKWNDLAIFFGLVAMFALISFEALPVHKTAQVLLSVVFLVSLFFLAAVNFTPVWIAVGLFSFAFLVYGIMRGKFAPSAFPRETPRVNVGTVLTALLLLSSIAFVAGGGRIGDLVAQRLGVTQIEARPSWQSTLLVGKEVYRSGAWLLGSGPNSFAEDWSAYRPAGVNATPFWNADFVSGVGVIPTSFVTAGLLGGLAWLLFLGYFLYAGFRALILRSFTDRFSLYLSLSSFLGALYLWGLCLFYIPSPTLIAFAFLLSGVFIASLSVAGQADEWRFSFADNPRIGFAVVLLVSLALLVSVGSLFIVGKKYAAAVYFQRSLIAGNVRGDLNAAERDLARALALDENDFYLRGAAEEGILRLGRVASDTSLSADEARAQFQSVLGGSVGHALAATRWNPNDYRNWMTLASVYQAVVPLKIQGAYESAAAAYERARERNPLSPLIPISLARLSASNGDAATAKLHITEALQKKNDYAEAVYLLSQIEIGEGKIREAISSTEAAIVLAPQNPGLYFQLGLLRYGSGQFGGAGEAFQAAVRINDSYANARYYLGLVRHKEGRIQDAIREFERVLALNPDNEDVKSILENLRRGRDPLSGVESPGTTPPIRGE